MSSGGSSDTSYASTIGEIRKKEYKILVIDDDDDFRKSFCFKLKRIFKAQVEDVDSGKSGIEKLRDGNSYDLIFTDIMMPEMTGIETYHELRKIDPKIRIVVMSAYSNSEDWKRAQALKDITLIHKPIQEHVLIKILSDR
jgi:CheY-like chemotaxis protein